MNGIAICFRQIQTTRHLVGRPDVMYFLRHVYGTTDHMISIYIAETDEFIDIPSAVLSDFSDEFSEFAGTLMKRIIWKCHMMHQLLLTCTYIF